MVPIISQDRQDLLLGQAPRSDSDFDFYFSQSDYNIDKLIYSLCAEFGRLDSNL